MPETTGTINRFNKVGFEVVVGTTRLRCTSTLWQNINKHFKIGDNVLAEWQESLSSDAEHVKLLRSMVKLEEKDGIHS